MQLIERPDLTAARVLHEHPDIYDDQRQRLFSYLSQAPDIVVDYEQHVFDDLPLGRYYPKNGMMSATFQWTRVRATLFAASEYDFDIVNCHPVLLRQMAAEELGRDDATPALDHYIDKREECFSGMRVSPDAITRFNRATKGRTSERDMLKAIYVITIYGGDVKTWAAQFKLHDGDYDLGDFYPKYAEEIARTTRLIVSSGREVVAKRVAAIRAEHNKDKRGAGDPRTLSILLQDVEQRVVLRAMRYVSACPGFEVSAYTFDGMQVRPEAGRSDAAERRLAEIAGRLSSVVKEDVGYLVRFVVKPFKDALDLDAVPAWRVPVLSFFSMPTHANLAAIIREIVAGCLVRSRGSTYWYGDSSSRSGLKQGTGGRWRKVGGEEVRGLLRTWVRERVQGALQGRGLGKKQLRKCLTSLQNTGFFKSACDEVVEDAGASGAVDFDADPHLLNVKNGTLDLRTDELRDHASGDYITKMTAVEFDPERATVAAYEKVATLIRTWFDFADDADEVVRYFLFVLATCLDGANSLQKALVLLGKRSRNGKSTFVNFLRSVMDDYVGKMDLTYLTDYEKNSESPKPMLLALRGCRFVVVDEADSSATTRIHQRQFKGWTGKDEIKCRDLYMSSDDATTFTPQGTMLVVANENLMFHGESNAISNRLMYYNFDCWFGSEDQPGWSEKDPNCRRVNPNFPELLAECKADFLHALVYLRKTVGHDFTAMDAPLSLRDFAAECLEEIDTVRSWCNEYLAIDHSSFDRYAEKDAKLCEIFPNLHGKERMLTLDFAFEKYKANCENAVSDRDFKKQISLIYSDLFDRRKKTKCFGGQRRYIRALRYTGFDRESDSGAARRSEVSPDDEDRNERVRRMVIAREEEKARASTRPSESTIRPTTETGLSTELRESTRGFAEAGGVEYLRRMLGY